MRLRRGLFALALGCTAASGQTPPVVVGFDDVAAGAAPTSWAVPLPQSYGGLEWRGGEPAVANAEASELLFPFMPSSGRQALFGGADGDELQISPWRGRFDFLGARFCVWGEATTGTISFSGWAGEAKLRQAGPFVIDRTFRPIDLDWRGLDRLTIQASGVFLMDDFRYRPAPVPQQGPPQEATRSANRSE